GPPPLGAGPGVAGVAVALLGPIDPSPGVRLLGVRTSTLVSRPARQLTFEEAEEPWKDATRAVDEVRRRFGDEAVGPASLVGEGGMGVKRRGHQQWGPEG